MLGLLALGLGATSFISDALNRKAAKKQAEAAAAAQQENIEAMNQRYTQMQEMLSPYTTAGSAAVEKQQALSGALGPEAQQAAIQAIEQGPQLQSMIAQGENSMLQNASATGGLRGGNLQGALATFAPQMLNQAIQQQYSQLGGLAQMGAQAGGLLGQAGLSTAGATGDMNTQMALMNAQPGGMDSFFGSLLTGLGSGLGAYTGLGGTFQK